MDLDFAREDDLFELAGIDQRDRPSNCLFVMLWRHCADHAALLRRVRVEHRERPVLKSSSPSC